MPRKPDKASRAISIIRRLRQAIRTLRNLEHERSSEIRKVTRREAFNFALFQYNPLTTVVVDGECRVVKSNMAKRKSGDRLPGIGDVMYRDYASHHELDMYGELKTCIRTGEAKSFPEMKYGPKVLSIMIAPFPGGAMITTQDISEAKRVESDRLNLIEGLRRALTEVEQLRGLLPICASCKKIRDDTGYWNQIEEYFSKRGNLNFSHTVCPDCIRKLYPEFAPKLPESGEKSPG
jgi:hypothetical protein